MSLGIFIFCCIVLEGFSSVYVVYSGILSFYICRGLHVASFSTRFLKVELEVDQCLIFLFLSPFTNGVIEDRCIGH